MNVHLSKGELSDDELNRVKELKAKLDMIKKSEFNNYINELEHKYFTFFDEIEILNEARKEEDRINNFMNDLNRFRVLKQREKNLKRNKVKVIDRRAISKRNA